MEIKGASQSTSSYGTNSPERVIALTSVKSASDGANINKSTEIRTKEIKELDVKKAVDKLNVFLEDDKTHAVYEIHPKFKDVMIKIVDDKTGAVVLEIPPKKILDMIAKMCEMVGVMVDKKA